MLSLPPALAPLGAWPQFVCWRAEPNPNKPGKFSKFPIDWRTGHKIDAHDPQYWTTADLALAMAPQWDVGYGSGAGFVFTAADPFFFHDIDNHYDRTSGQWSVLAQDLCARFAGCAVEVSHSGTGLHVIGRAAPMAHATRNTPKGLELYTSKRFVALTGVSTQGDAAHDATGALATVVAEYFPPSETGDWEGWTSEPVAEFTGPTDDDDLIRRAIASGSRSAAVVFGDKASFGDLWEANAEALTKAWPQADSPTGYGRTEADQTLANLLAFWAGKDCDRMERLMRRSALARDKWDVHRTYLADTILKACAYVSKVYTKIEGPKAEPLVPIVPPEEMARMAANAGRTLRDPNFEIMNPGDQLAFFAGCWFNNSTGMVYSLSRNTELPRAVFDVNYGGHLYILDPMNAKMTDSAWEAFTKGRVNTTPIVDSLCFRPERGPGEIVTDGLQTYVNSYVPHEPVLIDGDAGPFLRHLAKLIPDANDLKIFTSYLAALVQYPGRKFQWWPVIQGVEGNGKTMVFSVLEYALGQHYTHKPDPEAMVKTGNQFNDWIYRKLLILVEEIAVHEKRDFLNTFKSVVTNERMVMEGKGAAQRTRDNRANGMLATNLRNGVPITVDQRRYSIFYTAQQTREDLLRDGMTPGYFADLWDWLRGREAYAHLGENYGMAVFSNYLHAYAIEDEYNPARLSIWAPVTTSTAEALMNSQGRAEQEVLDAIDEGRPGFAGGWISSKAVDSLIADQLRIKMLRTDREAMILALGYIVHPNLRGGRVQQIVNPDGGKPRLYVKPGHLSLNELKSSRLAEMYTKAQTPDMGVLAAAVFGS